MGQGALAEAESDDALLGRLEGEAFDAKLRAREGSEREERLARVAMGAEEVESAGRVVVPGELAILRQRNEELASFYRAVLRSRGWRLLQLLRRPFGRAW